MRKILVSMVIILMLFSIISVKAENLKTLDLTSDKYEIEKGEQVVLTISSNELTGIEGTLKYDTSVWTLTNKTSQNSFTLNDATGKFALANLGGEEEITVTLTLKSEKSVTVESSTITISGIVGSGKTGEGYEISDKSITIKFQKDQVNPPVEEDPEEPQENTFEGIPEQKPEQTTNNTVNKVEKLPQTGSENIFAIITIVGIVAGISYFKYKKYNF